MTTRRARAVVIGGGIAGSSVAYHLAGHGWRDIVVLDQGPLAGGTTSHAPGLVGQLRSSASLTRMLLYSVSLYRTLHSGGEAGFDPVGSLRLASSKERLEELKRQAGLAKAVGLEARLLTPAEALDLFPLMEASGVEGALHIPTDGSARARILAQALQEEARRRGVAFEEGTRVAGIEAPGRRARAVLTDRGGERGRIEADTVVIAGGVWSGRVARLAGVDLPVTPLEHQYAVFGPIEGLGRLRLPNLRDPDRLVYFRQDGENLALGGYERGPRAFDPRDIGRGVNPTVVPFDEARWRPLWEAGTGRVPALGGLEPALRVNGLEAFTPDGEFLLGESPEVRGLWIACGFCAHGVSGAGGVGQVLARWIAEGDPGLDVWSFDVRRFGPWARGDAFASPRALETAATYYDISYPFRERASARGLRLSPVHERLVELGAALGEKAGWERPLWFEPNARWAEGRGWPRPSGWGARSWSAAIGAEHQAARERVALFDETSFAKIEAEGPGALAFLQGLTDNQMDKPPGSITYTQLLNEQGGVECDLTVTRLGPRSFRLITGAAFGTHDLAWLESRLPADGSVTLRDATSSLCCLGLWGPRSRELLWRLSEDDWSNEAFPYMTAREVRVGGVPLLAARVTYVGELGWELYAPIESGLRLWDLLWEKGKPFDMLAAGYRAIDSLRLEKGYRYWSADVTPEYNPYEAGQSFCVKLGKGDFVGREALEAAKKRGIARRLSCLVLEDEAAWPLGGEPIIDPAAGETVGRVTSGGYGYTVRKSIAYGYLPAARAEVGRRLAVELFGGPVRATVYAEPLYDPSNAKVKA